MLTRTALTMLLALTLAGIAAPALHAAGFDKLSPFSMVRWQGEQPEVEVQGKWYRLIAIDGITTERILAFCKDRYPERWDKRFCEDLVEVLHGMRHPPGDAVSLEVAELKGGKHLGVAGRARSARCVGIG